MRSERLLEDFRSRLGTLWNLKRDLDNILEAIILNLETPRNNVIYSESQALEHDKSALGGFLGSRLEPLGASWDLGAS